MGAGESLLLALASFVIGWRLALKLYKKHPEWFIE